MPKKKEKKKKAKLKQSARLKKAARKAPARKKKAVAKRKPARRKPAPRRRTSGASGGAEGAEIPAIEEPGLAAAAGGQSGDTQGLAHFAEASSESVEELAEEGQSLEAGLVSGVEDAPDADEGEVKTREVLEDDVPKEYDDSE